MSLPDGNGKLALIALLGAITILVILTFGDLYTGAVCIELIREKAPLPETCTNGTIAKTGLELAAIAAGLYGAVRLVK